MWLHKTNPPNTPFIRYHHLLIPDETVDGIEGSFLFSQKVKENSQETSEGGNEGNAGQPPPIYKGSAKANEEYEDVEDEIERQEDERIKKDPAAVANHEVHIIYPIDCFCDLPCFLL